MKVLWHSRIKQNTSKSKFQAYFSVKKLTESKVLRKDELDGSCKIIF